jgi:hypothetical protein
MRTRLLNRVVRGVTTAVLFAVSVVALSGTKPRTSDAAEVPTTMAPAPSVTRPAPVAEPRTVDTMNAAAISVETAQAVGISPDVLNLALRAVSSATQSGVVDAPPTLTVIDYSRPSVEPRLWVFDLQSGELLFKELVAHGKNTGANMALRFSNEMNSLQSSLGLFVTGEPYVGSNGYSLRLEGLDAGFNDRARERAIVMHGAPYVDAQLAAAQGRIGRSWGCPALRPAVARTVIDRIRGGSAIFAYYPDEQWLSRSRFLQPYSEGVLAMGVRNN